MLRLVLCCRHGLVEARIVLDASSTERLDTLFSWRWDDCCSWMTSFDVFVAIASLTEGFATFAA